MIADRPMAWATLYCVAVDKLLDAGLITWYNKDDRGAYYSTIVATKQGIEAYALATQAKNGILVSDSIRSNRESSSPPKE
jgi:hypothetical protein